MIKEIYKVLEIKSSTEIFNYHYAKIAGYLTLPISTLIGCLYYIFTGLTNFFNPVADALLPIVVLSVIDVALGLWCSLSQGNKFSSHRLVVKKLVLATLFFLGLAGILSFEGLLMFYTGSKISGLIAMSFCVFYGLYELSSILENINIVYYNLYKEKLPFIGPFLKLVKKNAPEALHEGIDKILEHTKEQIVEETEKILEEKKEEIKEEINKNI